MHLTRPPTNDARRHSSQIGSANQASFNCVCWLGSWELDCAASSNHTDKRLARTGWIDATTGAGSKHYEMHLEIIVWCFQTLTNSWHFRHFESLSKACQMHLKVSLWFALLCMNARIQTQNRVVHCNFVIIYGLLWNRALMENVHLRIMCIL